MPTYLNQLIEWVEASVFADAPDVLAEALACASWLGQVGVAKQLLDRGVEPAAGTATQMSALHWAANRGQLASVQLLIERGAPQMRRGPDVGAPTMVASISPPVS